jgi:hypothetical protein
VNILHSSVFGQVELRHCSEPRSACALCGPAVADPRTDMRRRCLKLDRSESAAEWLLSAGIHGDDLDTLRRAVWEDAHPTAWLTNAQLVNLVADKVARRDLCLVLRDRYMSMTNIGANVVAAAAATGMTPSMLRPREQEFVVEAPLVEETMDDINHALQAAALEEAARDGVPFCEECAKAQRAREASASSSVA